jgi:hypothetical protein
MPPGHAEGVNVLFSSNVPATNALLKYLEPVSTVPITVVGFVGMLCKKESTISCLR